MQGTGWTAPNLLYVSFAPTKIALALNTWLENGESPLITQ